MRAIGNRRAPQAGCVAAAGSLHRGLPAANRGCAAPTDEFMRAEIQKLVEEIKQSVGLLRRHL
jgi:hypothetical protein